MKARRKLAIAVTDLPTAIHDEIARSVEAGEMFKLQPFLLAMIPSLVEAFRERYGKSPKQFYLQRRAEQPPQSSRRRVEGHEVALCDAIEKAVERRRSFCAAAFLRKRGVKSVGYLWGRFADRYGMTPKDYYLARVVDRVRELQAERPNSTAIWLVMCALPKGATEALVHKVLRLLQTEQSKAAA